LIGLTRVTNLTEFGFRREEYGVERDILLLPCELVNLDYRRAFLWTPTSAARNRRDPWVVEILADVNLRDRFGLQDGDVVEISVPLPLARSRRSV
jgi:CTP-dependent riboflavin kinase